MKCFSVSWNCFYIQIYSGCCKISRGLHPPGPKRDVISFQALKEAVGRPGIICSSDSNPSYLHHLEHTHVHK